MSIELQSPYSSLRSKRFLEDDDQQGRHPLAELGSKRLRQQASPGRCVPGGQAYAVGHSTVAALRALFPQMNDKVIAEVLSEYGNNIDAAIKHLNELRLGAGQAERPGEAAQPGSAQAAEQLEQQQQQQQRAVEGEPAGPDGAAAVGGGEAAGGGGTGGASTLGPKTAAEWVDTVVQQMAEASSLEDAKQRAAALLQAFEQAAVQHAKQGSGGEQERLRLQLQELAKENQLLKRAVAIQNTRLQELGGKEMEAQQLKQLLEGYQQKVHALEVQNYSLALHLKQATDSRDPLRSNQNPDVF